MSPKPMSPKPMRKKKHNDEISLMKQICSRLFMMKFSIFVQSYRGSLRQIEALGVIEIGRA